MQKKWLIALVCMLAFVWCSGTALAYEVKVNDQIAQELRDTMGELSTNVFTALQDFDSSVFDNLFTDDAKKVNEENGLTTDDFIGQVNSALETTDVELANEFEINFDASETGKDQIELTIDPQDDGNYTIDLPIKPIPAYIMVFHTFGSGSMESTVILEFQKINNDWKLNFFFTGLHLLDGKTSADWYADAQSSYENGQLIPAALQVSLAKYLVDNLGIYKFKQAGEINTFNTKVQEDISKKYTFPVALADVEGKPQIIGIQSQYYESSICPVVSYITTKDLSDVDALQTEAEGMVQSLEKTFPGLTKMSSKILFDAFLEMPTSQDAEFNTSVVLLDN